MNKLPQSRIRSASLRVRFTQGELKALNTLLAHSYSAEDRPAPSTFMHDLAVAFISHQKRRAHTERVVLGRAITHPGEGNIARKAHTPRAGDSPNNHTPTERDSAQAGGNKRAIAQEDEDRFLQEFFEEIAARASTTVVEEK